MCQCARCGRAALARTADEYESEFEFDQEFEVATPTLRRGARGSAVRELQSRLKAAGYDPGPIDGDFGPRTQSAVLQFQRAKGLLVDGIVGAQTWRALQGSGGSSPVSPPAVGADRWVIPANVIAAGDAQTIPYDGSTPWRGERGCSGRFTPGARELGQFIQTTFPGVRTIGGYNCRPNSANTNETSIHGIGRAIDIMIDRVGGRANSAVGDPIANWLILHAQEIGIQYIIWNRVRWSGSRTPHQAAYGGPNPHTDHIHAELTIDAANRRTPWFQNRAGGAPNPELEDIGAEFEVLMG